MAVVEGHGTPLKHAQLVYKSPVKFTIRQRFSLLTISNSVAIVHRLLSSTCAVQIREESGLRALQAKHGGVILAFWHEVLPLAIWSVRGSGYHTLTSYSYDGELAARVIEHFGLAAVRGSSSRGGREALQQLEIALNLGVTVGVTLDGPRGPRRVAKPGVAILSGRTGIPIVPMTMGAPRGWRMRSWDRLFLPKPFTTITCVYGEPIDPARDSSAEEVERVRMHVERELNRLQAQLENELGMEAHLEPAQGTEVRNMGED